MFRQRNLDFPEIRIGIRSGDTTAGERRRLQKKPPEILITTPESLNLLLSSQGGLSMLGEIDTVILDEIHSVINNKRGVFLMSAVERLVQYSGEFQRLSLSATVKPMEDVASFVAGYRLDRNLSARKIGLVKSTRNKTRLCLIKK